MSQPEPFDPLLRFAEIERLVAKIYYRFSHLFLDQPELRDFWWEMAHDEEQHAAILFACKALIDNYDDERLDPEISRAKADELKEKLLKYLSHGTAKLQIEDAFRIALQIEGSEIDAIYSKLLQLGGPHIAQTMQNLGVPASVQRQKIKSALRRFCNDPAILTEADRL
jgi:hypothetical protein